MENCIDPAELDHKLNDDNGICRYSLRDALDTWGFDTEEKKSAFQDMLQLSNILHLNTTIDKAFPERNTFPELKLDINFLVKETQKGFVVRTGTQERWEVNQLEWMEQNQDQIFRNLKILGFIDEIKPKELDVDALCILGATSKSMKDRIKYAMKSGLKPKAVILLAGERYVTEGVDGTGEYLAEIAKELNLSDWRQLTETDLIKKLYYDSSFYKANKDIDVHVIDTPRGSLPRPTTKTTIEALIHWLTNDWFELYHEMPKNMIFITNQPYAFYQKAIIDSMFKGCLNMEREVIGGAAKCENIQSCIGALGSYIWSAAQNV